MPRIRRRLGDHRRGAQNHGVGSYSFAQFLVIFLGIVVIIVNLKSILEHEQGEIRLRSASIQEKQSGNNVDQTLIGQIVEQAAQKAATETKSAIEDTLSELGKAPISNEALKNEETHDEDPVNNGGGDGVNDSETALWPRKPPRIPNVLVAGVQRGATTSLTKYLSDNFHACSNRTDPLFFADADIASYGKLYSNCPEDSMIFVDGSPDALMYPEELKRLYDGDGSIDDLKVIVTLREPVERELSSYTYRRTQLERSLGGMNLVKGNGSVREFSEDIRDRLLRDLKRGNQKQLYGHYAIILGKWFELFDRKQILVLSYDELKSNQMDYLKRIHSFLSLEPSNPVSEFPFEAQSEYHEEKTEKLCKFMNYMWVRFFRQQNAKLNTLMQDNPGPEMEQYPFPTFEVECQPVEEGDGN